MEDEDKTEICERIRALEVETKHLTKGVQALQTELKTQRKDFAGKLTQTNNHLSELNGKVKQILGSLNKQKKQNEMKVRYKVAIITSLIGSISAIVVALIAACL